MKETPGVSSHRQVTNGHYAIQMDTFDFPHISTGFNTYLGAGLKLSRLQGNFSATPELPPL